VKSDCISRGSKPARSSNRSFCSTILPQCGKCCEFCHSISGPGPRLVARLTPQNDVWCRCVSCHAGTLRTFCPHCGTATLRAKRLQRPLRERPSDQDRRAGCRRVARALGSLRSKRNRGQSAASCASTQLSGAAKARQNAVGTSQRLRYPRAAADSNVTPATVSSM
jgi:hypothetical protein